MNIAKGIVIAFGSAAYTSSWWALAMFGPPGQGKSVVLTLPIIVAMLGSIALLVGSALALAEKWEG